VNPDRDGVADIVATHAGHDPAGCCLRVLHGGGTVIEVAAGRARTSQPAPLDQQSVFYVGSIAKQFVAACVALLEHDGALSIDDPVAAHVPRLPGWGRDVEVRHLLHHTSGLTDPDWRANPGVPPTGVPAWSTQDLLERVRDVRALTFAPGSRYEYSNRGYLLLAEVVARAADATVPAFAHDRIFTPLGMADTAFRDRPEPLPAAAARGHFVATDGALHEEPARFHAVGAGGLWTTTGDLAIWDANLHEDRLTGGWLTQRLTTRGTLDDDTPIHYAWGVSVRTHHGLPIVSHGGSFPGWNAKMVRFPSAGATMICLANTDSVDASALVFQVADLLLGDAMDPAAPSADQTLHLDRP
jgi:CubicO group peptidase (beta-lactamase class C family)